MKKLILLLTLLFVSQSAFAFDYSTMCAPEPYQVSSGFPRFMSNATGMNFLLTQVAESKIQKSLRKEFDSKFKVEIEPFGAKNFVDGKFKSMKITSPRIAYSGLNMSNFSAQTICGYNQVVIKNKKDILFPENLVFNYSSQITNKDLQDMVSSKDYKNLLDKLTLKIANQVIFRVFDPSAKIVDKKISMSFKVQTPLLFTTEVSSISLNTGLIVKDEQIVFSDVNWGGSAKSLNLSKMMSLVNKLNPLSYEVDLTQNAKGIVKVSNVKIDNDKILIDGVFIIPKNYAITK